MIAFAVVQLPPQGWTEMSYPADWSFAWPAESVSPTTFGGAPGAGVAADVLAGAVVTEVGCEEPERPVAEAPPVGGATDVDVVEDVFAGAVPGASGGRTDPDVARCCDAEMLPPELQEAAAHPRTSITRTMPCRPLNLFRFTCPFLLLHAPVKR